MFIHRMVSLSVSEVKIMCLNPDLFCLVAAKNHDTDY